MQAAAASPGWRKFGVLLLGVAAVGLPVNHVGAYALLVILAVIVFSGEVSARPRPWLAAVGDRRRCRRRAIAGRAAAHR